MKSGLVAILVACLTACGLSAPAGTPTQQGAPRTPGTGVSKNNVSIVPYSGSPKPTSTKDDPIAKLPDTTSDPPDPNTNKPAPTSTDLPINPKQGTEILTSLLKNILHGHPQNSHHRRHVDQDPVIPKRAVAVDAAVETTTLEPRTVGIALSLVQKVAKKMGLLKGLGGLGSKKRQVGEDAPAQALDKRQLGGLGGLLGGVGGLTGPKKPSSEVDDDEFDLDDDSAPSRARPTSPFSPDIAKRDSAVGHKRQLGGVDGLLGGLGGLTGPMKPSSDSDDELDFDGDSAPSRARPTSPFPPDVAKRDVATPDKRQLGGPGGLFGSLGALSGQQKPQGSSGKDNVGLDGPTLDQIRSGQDPFDAPAGNAPIPDNRGNPQFSVSVPGLSRRGAAGGEAIEDKIDKATRLMSLLTDGDAFSKRVRSPQLVPLSGSGKPDLGVTDMLANKPPDLGVSDAINGAVKGGTGKDAETHPGLFKPIGTLLGLNQPLPKQRPGLPGPHFDPTGRVPKPGEAVR